MSEHLDRAKLFALNNLAIEASIRRVEHERDIDLGHRRSPSVVDETYYPQFEGAIRREAAEMSVHYRVFYCLENSIRTLVTAVMSEAHGDDWWEQKVAQPIKAHVAGTQKKEREAGVSARSQAAIDYTTFGELGEIIKANWTDFKDIFRDVVALEKVISTLNVLRGPIAHCKPLAEDEVLRLHLSVRDWFRAME
jgi:hypothetical protein